VDALIHVFVDDNEIAAMANVGKDEHINLTGLRVLLVEDNDINQQIAVELLEGVGATVTVANHGAEALALLTGGPFPPPFDVVLMDLQMPVMDGHQATRRIRADARFAGLPIIAMTAHATVEEREACLANGMNGHIAKPIEPALFFAKLAGFMRPEAPGTPAPAPVVAPPAEGLPVIPGLDTADGLARVAGNVRLYLKLLRQFAEQQAEAPSRVSAALAAGDRATAERVAHSLKGVAGNLGASRVQASAAALEKLIRTQAPPGEIDAKLRDLSCELVPLLAQLGATLGDPTAAVEPTPSPAAPADPAATCAAASRLAALLTEFDAGAVDFLENNQAALRPLFNGKDWKTFQDLANGYAFSDALALLRAAAPNLKS
jgi:CheY-like chemotaxis protein